MNYATIKVYGNQAVVRDLKPLTSGTVGAAVTFKFDDAWNGMAKTLVWHGSGVFRDDTACTGIIPAEVLTKSGGRLRVGVYGTLGGAVLPTVWVDLGIILRGADPSGDESTDPALPIWATLLTDVSTLQGQMADLLYEAIAITAFSVSPSTVELGSAVDSVMLNWALNKDPVAQTMGGVAMSTSQRSTTMEYDGDSVLSANTTFTLVATDERGATATKFATLSFLNGVYYGVMEDDTTLDSAAVLTLTKKLQSSRALSFTVTAGATQRIAFAIPTRYGTPNFNVGGFDGGFHLASTIDLTNASGYTESYDVWLSENTGLGSTTVKVT